MRIKQRLDALLPLTTAQLRRVRTLEEARRELGEPQLDRAVARVGELQPQRAAWVLNAGRWATLAPPHSGTRDAESEPKGPGPSDWWELCVRGEGSERRAETVPQGP